VASICADAPLPRIVLAQTVRQREADRPL